MPGLPSSVREVLPAARLEVLADCGRAINFDQPKVTAGLLGAFLADCRYLRR